MRGRRSFGVPVVLLGVLVAEQGEVRLVLLVVVVVVLSLSVRGRRRRGSMGTARSQVEGHVDRLSRSEWVAGNGLGVGRSIALVSILTAEPRVGSSTLALALEAGVRVRVRVSNVPDGVESDAGHGKAADQEEEDLESSAQTQAALLVGLADDESLGETGRVVSGKR